MDKQTVAIKGPGGKYGRPDAPNTGPWADLKQGWRGIVWDGESASAETYHWTLTKPDSRFALVPDGIGGWFGIDATKYTGDIGEQFYVTPDGRERGPYESPVVYTGTLDGYLLGVVEYGDGKYPSCAFSVEVVS